MRRFHSLFQSSVISAPPRQHRRNSLVTFEAISNKLFFHVVGCDTWLVLSFRNLQSLKICGFFFSCKVKGCRNQERHYPPPPPPPRLPKQAHTPPTPKVRPVQNTCRMKTLFSLAKTNKYFVVFRVKVSKDFRRNLTSSVAALTSRMSVSVTLYLPASVFLFRCCHCCWLLSSEPSLPEYGQPETLEQHTQ